jgi:hypothetical protein
MRTWIITARNSVYAAFLLGVSQSSCIKVSTIAQAETAANEDITCGKDIQADVDANEPIESIVIDPTVVAACTRAAYDDGKAIADIVTDIAAKSPNTVAGKQATARLAAKALRAR